MVLALAGCGVKKEEAAPEPAPVKETAETQEPEVEEEVEDEIEDEVEEVVEEPVSESADVEVFDTIEDYYRVDENYDEFIATLKEVYDQSSDIYSNIAFNVSGNTMTLQYFFLNDPNSSIQESINTYFDELSDEEWTAIRDDLIRTSGVTSDIEVVYEYYDTNEDLVAVYSALLPGMM